MFIGYASRAKCKSLGLMGEVILNKVKGHLKIPIPGSEWRTEDDHEQREIKNPLL